MTCLPSVVDGLLIISCAGGFLGGLSMIVYMRPSSAMDGIRRVVVSTIAGALMAEFTATKLFGSKEPELVMASAFLIGFMAWNVLGATAKFFENRQHEDIVGMLKSAKETMTPSYGQSYYKPTSTQPMPRKDQIDAPE
jgi:hypothetical protein